MSLTTYLKSKDFEECIRFQEEIKKITPEKKDFIALESNYKAFETKRDLKAPYYLETSKDAMLVGTTFDYLARFRIAQVISENKIEAIEKVVSDNFFDFSGNKLSNKTFNKIQNRYLRAKSNIQKYIFNNRKLEDIIIESAFTLAILEQCWRGKKLPKDVDDLLEKPSEIIKYDLKNLMVVFEENFINKVVKKDSLVKFNPDFGACSYAIGGADADIYIDGTLYDFKCTKSLGYKAIDARQIIGYYVLDVICKKRKSLNLSKTLMNNEINRVALYSARVGEIYYFDVAHINSEKLRKVILEVEDILFNNRSKVVKSNSKRKIKRKSEKSHFFKYLTILLFILVLFGTIVYFLKEIKYNSQITNITGNNTSYIIEDIREDYEKKRINSQELLTKGQGIFRYHNALIKTLRSYDVSNLENAKVVYELSDELLNNMYQNFKMEFSEDKFKKITKTQIKWIDNKMQIEKNLKDDELAKYQKFIYMTLDKCEEWTNYYK